MVSFVDLPYDILHYVLLQLPDFSTLSTAIRISKRYYNLFLENQKTVIASIKYTVAGPALVQAARLTFSMETLGQVNEANTLDSRFYTLGRPQLLVIEKNAAVIVKYERLFSQRYKDRTSSQCRLTPEESLRFQRALYRFWLYCFLAEIDWQHDEPVDTHWAERFLQEFSTQELLEMIRVSRFVKEVVDWTDCAANSPGCSSRDDEVIMIGLDKVIDAYESVEPLDDAVDANFDEVTFDIVVKKVLESRDGVDGGNHESDISKSIVTHAAGRQDRCYRCQARKGLRLWNRTNWCRLRDHISVTELSTMLHAGLSDDPLEVELLESCVLSRDADYRLTFSWDAFMEALSGITVTDEDPWLADQWYCISCIRELVASRFMHWWTNTKRGISTPRRAPNCSCGYACDSQTFNPQPEEGELYDYLCDITAAPAVYPTFH